MTLPLDDSWDEKFKRSEELDALLAIASSTHAFESVHRLFRINVIVDTNIICGDVLAILRKQAVGARRPAIMELLAKGVLIGFFPAEKVQEVEEKCREFSKRYGIPLSDLLEQWSKYREVLILVPTRDLELNRKDSRALAIRDPTDLPFLQARHIVGASVVLTNDPDVPASGAPAMPWSRALVDLRHHARHEGLHVALVLGSGVAITVPFVAFFGFLKLIHKAVSNTPPKVIALVAVGLAIALLIPQSRKLLLDLGRTAMAGLKEAGAIVGPALAQTLHAGARAKAMSDEMRPKLERQLELALRTRLTLTQAVYRVCLVENRPLHLVEIWTAAQRNGAKSTATNPLNSVLRALKRHPLVEGLPDGRWKAVPLTLPASND
jgi:predicted nucleic acid-binding protein